MTEKEPVLLVVLVETQELRWRVGAVDMNGNAIPLLRSVPQDLSVYPPLPFDEQASFLRHRFCGVLQRGCDRLWALKKKACHFAFLIDGDFPHAPAELTTRTAQHLTEWMANPPLSFHRSAAPQSDADDLCTVSGSLAESSITVLRSGLPELIGAYASEDLWEEVPPPRRDS